MYSLPPNLTLVGLGAGTTSPNATGSRGMAFSQSQCLMIPLVIFLRLGVIQKSTEQAHMYTAHSTPTTHSNTTLGPHIRWYIVPAKAQTRAIWVASRTRRRRKENWRRLSRGCAREMRRRSRVVERAERRKPKLWQRVRLGGFEVGGWDAYRKTATRG